MRRALTRAFLTLLAVAAAPLRGALTYREASQVGLAEIFAPHLEEFSAQHPPGGIYSFDLSPDGKTLAIENATREKDGSFGVWVTLWSVDNQHLFASQQIEWNYPTYNFRSDNKYLKGFNGTPFRWYEHKLRFSPDGHRLIVLTGPHLVVLNFPDLKTLYLIDDAVNAQSEDAQPVFTDFAVAANGGRLGLLKEYPRGTLRMYENGYIDLRSFEITITNFGDGKKVAHWDKSGHSESIDLSQDGELVALTLNPVVPGTGSVPAAENNVFVLNAISGEVVRALRTAHTMGDARFLPDTGDLATAPDDHGSVDSQFYSKESVDIWNVKTGGLQGELRYQKYGVRSASELAVSSDGKWLAAVSSWHNPSDIGSDRGVIRGWVRLLLWNIADRKLVYESRDLPSGYELQRGANLRLYGGPVLVRESASGTRLAVGGEHISVFASDADRAAAIQAKK